jgi:hypothetical protein
MKKSFVVLFALSLFFLMGGMGLAEVEIYDTFDNGSLAFNKTEGEFDFYDILGMAESDFARVVRVRNLLVNKKPAIQQVGPKGGRTWILATGSSTKFRDVHWQHQVDLRYNFDQMMSGAAISFKYLNTRACGGRVDIIFVQYAEDGSVVWYAKKRRENWENWPGRYSRLGGTVKDRTWRSYSLTAEETAALVQGRPFNCVLIREFDITSESGSGYFDDISIRVEPAAPPEPDTDNDGVIDKLDFCPESPTESRVDSMGCNLPDPVVGGGFIVVDDTREVSVRCAGSSGTNRHSLYARVNGEETYLFDSDLENQQVSLGILPVGTLIQFRLDVHETGHQFYSAGPEQNPDNTAHVQLISTENPFIWEGGFEDTYGESNSDFSDALFFVTAVSAVTASPQIDGAGNCPEADSSINANLRRLRIREYPRKNRGTLQLYMDYQKGAVDLASGEVGVIVQLSQDGKIVELNAQKSLKKRVNQNRKRRVNKISYRESNK